MSAKQDELPEFEKTILQSLIDFQIIAENRYSSIESDAFKVTSLPVYKDVVSCWDNSKKIDFIIYCLKGVNAVTHEIFRTLDATGKDKHSIQRKFLYDLTQAKLLFEDESLAHLCDSFSQNSENISGYQIKLIVSPIFRKIEAQYKNKDISATLLQSIENLRNSLKEKDDTYHKAQRLKLVEKIDNFIYFAQFHDLSARPNRFLGEDLFSDYANQTIDNLPEIDRQNWYNVIGIAKQSTGSKPSAKFLAEAAPAINRLGKETFKQIISTFFSFIIQLKEEFRANTYIERGIEHKYTTIHFLETINIDAVKGLVWMCTLENDNSAIDIITRLAERTYKKIPGKGPAAAAIGNACVYALYKIEGLSGIGELSRLKLRVKQTNTQKLIESYLLQAANDRGISIHEIEDLAVNDFGLKNRCKEVHLDNFRAIISLNELGHSEIKWMKTNGSPQKSIPISIKDKYAAELKILKDTAKQIDKTISAQKDRLDRMLRTRRTWTENDLQRLYFQHELMSFLAEKIIWEVNSNDEIFSVIRFQNQWINSAGHNVIIKEGSVFSLWHPVAARNISEIENWRTFIISKKIKQPFKQAFREVYRVTEAEQLTNTYSNRMAGHILKQHQFNTLAKGRAWQYSLKVLYDSYYQYDHAEITFPDFNLKAEYLINEVNAENVEYTDSGIWKYVSTDQIRFRNPDTHELIHLANVPIIAFSEILRDIDLFVGVSSIGNDPTWQDSGEPEVRQVYPDYWRDYSFGELSELAKTRKDILKRLIPGLKIASSLFLEDKFLIVKGTLRTYKIHIGSSNILMEPNDKYLCIVQDRKNKDVAQNIFLPFEDDLTLSLILSKAFLLANDSKIKDGSIISQIQSNL